MPQVPQTQPAAAPLPVDAVLPAVAAALAQRGACVVQAEPGAGKTTRVPAWLLEHGAFEGELWVVEPRRMAAVLAARHVAATLGERCGETVGYAVRFEEVAGPTTRLRFVTDGLLLRRLLHDPHLRGIGALVFDEFHERRLAMDLALATARLLRQTVRPELRLLVMSATLDAESLAQWLDAAVVQAPGRVFPVDIVHAATVDARPLHDQVAAAVRGLLAAGLDGDVLAFLPGAAEIRRTQEALQGTAARDDLAVLPLHGSLPLREQELAIAPQARRKVVLATNIAETSVTLPGVVAVVDSGWARVASYAAWSGLPLLQLQKISRASATQRAGRAGRVRAGRCLRLYTQFDGDGRPAYDKPEILRADLAEACLTVAQLQARLQQPLTDGFWLTAPEPQLWAQAQQTLHRLGALEGDQLTATGEGLLRWPLHPRLARMVVEAERLGAGELGVRVAALLGERDVRGGQRLHAARAAHGESDVWALLYDQDAVTQGAHPRDVGLDGQALRQAERAASQLRRHLRPPPRPTADEETALGLALLAGFGDRLARRRQPGQPELELPGGSKVQLGPRSQVTDAAFAVVLDAEERRDGKGVQTVVQLAHGVAPELLIEACAERVISEQELILDKNRVLLAERLLIDGLELERTVRPAPAGPEVSALLVRTALERGLLGDGDGPLLALRQRVDFARDQAGLDGLPALDDACIEAALVALAEGCVRLDELDPSGLLAALEQQLDAAYAGQGLRRLEQAAPSHVHLAGGRKLRIQYPQNQAPWTQSRLQDFFGLRDGPRVAGGKVAVVLHLLAPNQRPVQVTTDLAGFWARHYPALRKELGRRYPRHSWPDDPLTAEPPQPRSRP